MMGKVNLFLVTISLGLVYTYGSPLPSRGYDPFREEVVVPVPIVYTGDDSFENILNPGSYRYEVTSAEEVKPKPTAISTSSTEDEDDNNDDESDKSIVNLMEDAIKGKLNDDEDDDVDILNEGEGSPPKRTSDDVDDDEDDDDEDENEDEDEEGQGRSDFKLESKKRQEKYLFGSGINDSYGWYGWPNGHNNRRHHSHNYHHHHQPTYHHGFYTSYF